MSITKNMIITDSFGQEVDRRDIGAEAQNIDVSRNADGKIITDITASGVEVSSVESLTQTLKNIENNSQITLTFDETPTTGSDNPVKSKGLVPDTALSPTSTKPVQNKVVTEALSTKLSTYANNSDAWDEEPTINSIKPVTSRGIKNVLDNFYITTGQVSDSTLGDKATAEGYDTIASGEYSHAEGYMTSANGKTSHAEGWSTIANEEGSHSEGYGTKALGVYSHVEGYENIINKEFAHAEGAHNLINNDGSAGHVEGMYTTVDKRAGHAEGMSTRSSGLDSHAEGAGTIASGDHSHAEGQNTSAIGYYSHTEGYNTIANENASHAEGSTTSALGLDSHAEGWKTIANGDYSHVEGQQNIASGENSHAEGQQTSAIGDKSHAEGSVTLANNSECHAEGAATSAIGYESHSEGRFTLAKGRYSHAAGQQTIANYCQTVIGQYNVEQGSADSYTANSGYFIVGSGSYKSGGGNEANCFRATETNTYGKTYSTSGADYAEMFEWIDGNQNNEDRIGKFVTLDGNKIKLATSQDDYILGVISGNASVIGDIYDDQWKGMFETDIYGRPIYIKQERELKNGTKVYDDVLKVNPNYDSTKKYIPRSERPEWSAVGLLGKLICLDDGTSEANDYVIVNNDSIATKANSKTKYRVMKRVDGNHIQIMIL